MLIIELETELQLFSEVHDSSFYIESEAFHKKKSCTRNPHMMHTFLKGFVPGLFGSSLL
jgi:hypothetical protein